MGGVGLTLASEGVKDTGPTSPAVDSEGLGSQSGSEEIFTIPAGSILYNGNTRNVFHKGAVVDTGASESSVVTDDPLVLAVNPSEEKPKKLQLPSGVQVRVSLGGVYDQIGEAYYF